MIRQNGFTSRDFIISESLKEHKEQITLLDNSDLTLLCHVYFNNHCHNIHTNLWVSMKPKHIDTNTIFFFTYSALYSVISMYNNMATVF